MHPPRLSAATSARVCLSAALFVGAGACAKTPPQSLPETGSVTVGVTSRRSGVGKVVFGVSIEPDGIEGAVNGDVGIFTARWNVYSESGNGARAWSSLGTRLASARPFGGSVGTRLDCTLLRPEVAPPCTVF